MMKILYQIIAWGSTVLILAINHNSRITNLVIMMMIILNHCLEVDPAPFLPQGYHPRPMLAQPWKKNKIEVSKWDSKMSIESSQPNEKTKTHLPFCGLLLALRLGRSTPPSLGWLHLFLRCHPCLDLKIEGDDLMMGRISQLWRVTAQICRLI